MGDVVPAKARYRRSKGFTSAPWHSGGQAQRSLRSKHHCAL